MENLKMKHGKIEVVTPGVALAMEMRRQAQQLLDQAKKLELPTRLPRGTRQDVASHAAEALKHAEGATKHTRPDGSYHVGDEGPTPELLEAVTRLITEHPRTFQELRDLTGARDNRIKGVLMRMQRDGVTLANLGTEAKAIWFCPSPEALKRLERVMKSRKR